MFKKKLVKCNTFMHVHARKFAGVNKEIFLLYIYNNNVSDYPRSRSSMLNSTS